MMKKVCLVLSMMVCAAMCSGCAGAGTDVAVVGLKVTGPAAALLEQSQVSRAVQEDEAGQNAVQYDPVADDDIRSGYFKVDGVTYQLPVSCQEFLNQGWELDAAYHNTQLAPGNSLGVELKKGSGVLYVTIGNAGDEKQPLTSLPVISLLFFVQSPENSQIKVELPKGVVLSTDALSAVIAAHGEADSVSAAGPGNPYAKDVYSYQNPDERGVRISIRLDDEYQQRIRYVSIENEYEFSRKQKALEEAGASIAEPTEDVAAYQAPAELGTDITSGVIEFDGDLYRLPVPVSALQKNGWKLHVAFPSEVEPGGSQMVYLSRGDREIHQFIVNPGTETVVHSNCFADRWDTSNDKIKLAGIDVGASREVLLERIKGMDYEYDPEYFSGEDMYLVKLGYADDFIRIIVSDETDRIESIYIKKEQLHK